MKYDAASSDPPEHLNYEISTIKSWRQMLKCINVVHGKGAVI